MNKSFKKIFIYFLLIFLITNDAFACDICGCVLSGNYFGLLPQYRKHFVGIRTQFRSFHVEHPPLFANEQTIYSKDEAWTTESWARIKLSKLQLFASIPFQYNFRNEQNNQWSNHGIGDLSLLIGTTLLKSPDTTKTSIKQTLFASAGLKCPTGNYNHSLNNYTFSNIPGFQMGTGSWDFPFSINYTLRYKKIGFNTESQYLLRTTNKQNYRFGNLFNVALRGFYWHYRPAFTFLPSFALLFEHFQNDLRNHSLVTYSGGYAALLDTGIDFYKSAFGINFHTTFPIQQRIAKNHLTLTPRFSLTFLYLF